MDNNNTFVFNNLQFGTNSDWVMALFLICFTVISIFAIIYIEPKQLAKAITGSRGNITNTNTDLLRSFSSAQNQFCANEEFKKEKKKKTNKNLKI